MKQLFTYLVLLFSISISMGANAQTPGSVANSDKWVRVTAQQAPAKSLLRITPTTYLVYQLNVAALKSQLFALSTQPENGVVIKLPMPDGSFRDFKVWQTPMMPDALAAQYPDIKTFTAEAVNDHMFTAKLDFTLFGFHAAFYGDENFSQIDPYDNLNDGYYICYYKKDIDRPFANRMRCEVRGRGELSPAGEPMPTAHSGLQATDLSSLKISAPPGYMSTSGHNEVSIPGHEMSAVVTSNGTTLRSYRLALTANHFYCQAATGLGAPTIAQCFSAMTTTMNRVNGIYNREIAVQLNFCTNENLMIWPIATGSTNGPDPWDATSNSDAPTCLTMNQTQCDTRIGTTFYDIGHVFTTGAGGLAAVGVYCNAAQKAQGVTGSPTPVGDPFDIDYVAHEMGHQSGSSHTFNNNGDGSCSGNASASHAYEPASGATIMDYAGICSPDNIQPHSDAYFSFNSLEQIHTHITGSGNACAAPSGTGHAPATISPYVQTFNIPYKTPFELSRPAATPDAADTATTYGWFQWNLGDFGLRLNQTHVYGPLFRSYQPVYTTNRVFPQISTVLTGVLNNAGERAPDTARYMTFKMVVRGIFNGKGCFLIPDDSVHINTIATGAGNFYGGFKVTSQNSAVTYTGGTTQTVTWNVVGTNNPPVSCASVDIFMSTDGGFTWPYTVAGGPFANNGTASIVVPNPPSSSSTCRFKVKASSVSVNNIFFNVNSTNFTVNPGATTAPITGTFTVCAGATTPLADATPAGVWASSTPAVATVSASGVVTGVGSGTSTITYTPASGAVYAVVTVYAIPAPAAVTGSSTVCVGLTTPLGDVTPGGTWASSNIARATVDAAGVVTGVGAGAVTITYTVTNACGTGTATKAMTVSAPTAVAPITGTTGICNGNTTTLSCTTPGGVWSSTSTAVATISAGGFVSSVSPGTTTISYSITAGCTSASTVNVTVNALPVATTSPTGSITICTGGNVVITAAPITAGFTYQWQVGVANIPGETNTTYTASAAGNYRVVITNTTGCTGTSPVAAVTVNPLSVVVPSVTVTASPGTNICAAVGAVTFTATPANGGVPTYQWYVNGALMGAVGTTFTYTPTNGDIVKCQMTSSLPCAVPATVTNSVTMTVNPVLTPSVGINTSPGDTVCTGNPATYIAAPVNGGTTPTYQWSVNSVVVGTGPTYTNTPANGDIVFCQMTSSASCVTTPVATSAPLVMTVEAPIPNTVTISASPTSIVAGESVTFVAIALNAGPSPAYQWFIGTIPVTGATNATYTTNSLTNGQVVYCKVTSSVPCVLPHIGLSNGYTMTVISAGVWEVSKGGNSFTLNPNPNHGTFSVTGRGATLQDNDVNIVVTNVLGQAVYNATATIKAGHMDEQVALPAGMPSGIYLVTVTSGTDRVVLRMVLDK